MAKSRGKSDAPPTTLDRLIEKGDVEGTIAYLEKLAPAECAVHRPRLVRAHAAMQRIVPVVVETEGFGATQSWRTSASDDQSCAMSIALLVCGTARNAADAFFDDPRVFAALERLRPPTLTELGEALIARSPYWIDRVQRLIVAGLVQRPATDEYVLGLIALPRVFNSTEKFDAMWPQDPGLPEALLRVFEVEGTPDCSLASVEKYSHLALSWTSIFQRLCAEGVYSRSLLLERTLDALERGWIQHRSGWFSRFHDALSPSVAEMRPHVPRYMGLCTSRIPPTVTLALQALQALNADSPIAGDALAGALEAAVSSAVKGQVETALRMLADLVTREPGMKTRAVAIARQALAHDSKDVQAAALKHLKRWGQGPGDAPALSAYLPGIAATNRALLLELIGKQTAPSPAAAGEVPPPSPSPAPATAPLADELRLPPVADCTALVELIAHVFENDTDVDALEQALAALVTFAPVADRDRSRFSPVLKRAAKLRKPVPLELARLLAHCVGGGDDGARRDPPRSGVHDVLHWRVNDLIEVARQSRHCAPLAAPTHRGGFIDASVFVDRLRAHLDAGVRSGTLEQVLALLRLAASEGALEKARTLPDGPLVRALRHALGDEVPLDGDAALFMAAARIRHRGADDPKVLAAFGDCGPDGAAAARYAWEVRTDTSTYQAKTYDHHTLFIQCAQVSDDTPVEHLAVWRHPRSHEQTFGRFWTFAGSDEALIRLSATVLPGDQAAFCAEGVRTVGNNLDWWEAQWQNRAYIDVLLQPVTPIEGTAALLLALSLAGKEPGQTALGVDALVASWREQRLDADAFTEALARLMVTPLVKLPRLTKSLQAALRLEPRIEAFLFLVLCESLRRMGQAIPKDVTPLLELLLELKIAQGRTLIPGTPGAPGTIEVLRSLPLKGRASKIRNQLLDS